MHSEGLQDGSTFDRYLGAVPIKNITHFKDIAHFVVSLVWDQIPFLKKISSKSQKSVLPP
jgi:hypothetical protein